MQSTSGSQSLPEWLHRPHRPVTYYVPPPRTLSINGVLASFTIAFLVAFIVTFYEHPMEAKTSSFAHVLTNDDLDEDDESDSATPAGADSPTWLRGSTDTALPSQPSFSDLPAQIVAAQKEIVAEPERERAEAPAAPPATTELQENLSSTTVVIAPERSVHVSDQSIVATPEHAPSDVSRAPVPDTPKAPPKKRQVQRAQLAPHVLAHPCGTMQNCIAATARNPNVVRVMQACRSVLNGSGGARTRAVCDSVFANIRAPSEGDIPDEERRKAAAVCRGMPHCAELVMKRPSAAQLVRACGHALIQGSGPAADTCDRTVMSRI